MKRILSIILLCFSATVLFAQGFSFGVEGGLGVHSMWVKTSGTESDFDFIPGFRFGAGAEYAFSEVAVLQAKTLFHHKNGFSYISGGSAHKVSFMTLDIPLLVKLTFKGIKSVPGIFSVFAGPNFTVRIGDVTASDGGFTADGSEPFSLKSFAAGLEAGAEYAFTKSGGFRLGLSFVMDFSDFSDTSGIEARRYFLMPYLGYWF